LFQSAYLVIFISNINSLLNIFEKAKRTKGCIKNICEDALARQRDISAAMLHEWHRDKSDFAALITRGLRVFAIPF
jgi:hypothetical protein